MVQFKSSVVPVEESHHGYQYQLFECKDYNNRTIMDQSKIQDMFQQARTRLPKRKVFMILEFLQRCSQIMFSMIVFLLWIWIYPPTQPHETFYFNPINEICVSYCPQYSVDAIVSQQRAPSDKFDSLL